MKAYLLSKDLATVPLATATGRKNAQLSVKLSARRGRLEGRTDEFEAKALIIPFLYRKNFMLTLFRFPE